MNLPPLAQCLQFFHNHPALFVALGVVLLLFVANEAYGRIKAGPQLSTAAAVRLINDRDALVIDVRQPADYKKSHLLGAINIPADKLKDRVGELSRHQQRPVIVYCNMGGSSLEAARTLRALGFSDVQPLRGGINGWMSGNLPVTAK